MANFVSQEPSLGAARALETLGFDIDGKNPSTAALAFEMSYWHVRSLIDPASALRFTPTDHEHRLCKTIRTYKLLCEAGRGEDGSQLLAWANLWLSKTDCSPIPESRVKESMEVLNRE
jgi:hypothetical protein